MRSLKSLFLSVITTPGLVPNLLRGKDEAVIFMLHRFPDPALGNPAAHDVAALRSSMSYLRRRRFELVPLSTLYDRAAAGEPLGGAIAFTIDDGYRDHASIAAPFFAEFDCPVTTFLTTGFLDGLIWFWWDQIEYVFRNTRRPSLSVVFPDKPSPMVLRCGTQEERSVSQNLFTVACKRLSEADKLATIAKLGEAADVEIPQAAPKEYAPMSWADARHCETLGMTFGPHTVTHPILSRASDEQARFEIQESWRRVTTELKKPMPVFCYPNGQVGDFGSRETAAVAAAGMRGAVIGTPGYAAGPQVRDPEKRFYTPRYSMPEGLAHLIQYVTGLESVKARIRGQRN